MNCEIVAIGTELLLGQNQDTNSAWLAQQLALLGIDVFGTNTRIEGVNIGGVDFGRVAAGETFEVEFTFDCLLTRQDYTLTVATQHREGYSQDWLDDVVAFSVVDQRDVAGLASFKTKVNWRRIPV